MKKIIIILMIVSGFNLYAANPFQPAVASVKLNTAEKPRLITLEELNNAIKVREAQLKKELNLDEKEEILDALVGNVLILQAANRDGVVISERNILDNFKAQNPAMSDEQIKNTLVNQYKKTWPEILKALVDTYTAQQYVKLKGQALIKQEDVTPSNEEVIAHFNLNQTTFVHPDLVRVDHIFFLTRDQSPEVAAKAKKNADAARLLITQGKKSFEELVFEVSEDENSKKNNGELGFITRNNQIHVQLLGSEFIEKLFKIEMNEVSDVIKSEHGYHIVIVREKRFARLLKITDPMYPGQPTTVAQYIYNGLYQQKATEALSLVTVDIIKELKNDAVVKIIDKALPWN